MKKYCFLMSVLLGLMSCYHPAKSHVDFNKEKYARETQIVERLRDIREAEILYKQVEGHYTDNFDVLIHFCKYVEIPRVRWSVDSDGKTLGYDTIAYIRVMDSLFKNRPDFDIDQLSTVPFGNSNTQFEMNAGFVERKGLSIPVFEAKTPYEVYLAKPSKKFTEKEWNNRVKNLKDEMEQLNKYAGLKVGSMEEVTTDGNWERL